MRKALTNSKSRVTAKNKNPKNFLLTEEAKPFVHLVAGALIFALLVMGSMAQNNLFLEEILTVGFIALCILIIRSTQTENEQEVIAQRIRNNKNKTSK